MGRLLTATKLSVPVHVSVPVVTVAADLAVGQTMRMSWMSMAVAVAV